MTTYVGLDLDALEERWSRAFAVGDVIDSKLVREARETILKLIAELRIADGDLAAYRARHRNYTRRYRKEQALNGGRKVQRVVDATGTRRRLQALAFYGYDCTYVSKLARMDVKNLRRIRHGDIGYVQRGTAQRVKVIHDTLMVRRNDSRFGRRLQNYANGQGWLHSAAYDDIDNPLDEPHGVRRSA